MVESSGERPFEEPEDISKLPPEELMRRIRLAQAGYIIDWAMEDLKKEEALEKEFGEQDPGFSVPSSN